jgi:hypothetical protein
VYLLHDKDQVHIVIRLLRRQPHFILGRDRFPARPLVHKKDATGHPEQVIAQMIFIIETVPAIPEIPKDLLCKILGEDLIPTKLFQREIDTSVISLIIDVEGILGPRNELLEQVVHTHKVDGKVISKILTFDCYLYAFPAVF